MKEKKCMGFFKTVLASTVGVFIAMVIINVLSMVIFIGFLVATSGNSSFVLKDNSVLYLKLEGEILDRRTADPISELLGANFGSEGQMSLEEILSAIRKAKENDKIKGIYLETKIFSAGLASLQSIRNAVEDFKTSKKFVVAYADTYSQGGYYLASVADKVFVNPYGHLDLHGLSASPTFYKGLLDKIGVEMQIFKVGTFKSAVEPFSSTEMSEANRQQLQAYLTETWAIITQDISKSRKISVEQLNSLADRLPAFMPQDSLVAYKLTDALMYEVEVKNHIRTLLKIEKDADIEYATASDMTSVTDKKKGESQNEIAVLYAEGEILSGNLPTGITDEVFVEEIEQLRKNKDVKAVVLRVNSPGGSAYASEQIWKAVSDLKAEKPVVVSMGNYAASGGYYIACNAHKIVAEPTTLTGSIGIFGMFPNVQGLTQKLGLTFGSVKTNQLSDFGDITRPMTEPEKAILQSYINRGYELFTKRCADGRKMPVEKLKEVAEGRIWSGSQAQKLGLVDKLGGIDVAIKEAAALAKISDYYTESYPVQEDYWVTFLSNQREKLKINIIKEYLGEDFEMVNAMKSIRHRDHIQARLPLDIRFQ